MKENQQAKEHLHKDVCAAEKKSLWVFLTWMV